VITCPSCGEENPERARFCLNCATPLGPETTARPELKFATALFADLVGSTTLAEQEDPEVVQSVVGRAFDRLSVEIERYGGLLEKFMGDAMLAVFGVPKAHEDDPERAVRSALEMQAVLSELNRGFAAEGKPQLAMRIGIEAGDVLVDLERAAGPRDRMLTGDAVNTAARLEAAADPNHVVVGPAVYASTKAVIDYLELAPLDLKGKAEPVPAWQAQRVKAKRRGERPALGLEARLIGRDEEMTVLKQTLQRVETEGRPALVTIVGPAGVGKSRVTSELLRYVEGLPQFIYWRSGRCLAYGNTPYSAMADAIKAECEVLEDDPADVVGAKVDASVAELFGDTTVAPEIRALVGAGESTAFSREDLFEAWRRYLERMAARYPLVLALDDLHWADDGLLDLVEHVADWAQGPILLLVQARPELFDARPTWGGGKRNAASIYLDPLTPDEDAAMIDDLLPGEITDELKKLIVDRSEGNPLYTEEIVRMLIDRGVLRATRASRWEVASSVADVEVPRSIQGLISARLDGLPDDEKAILQDAAVVGREFWLGAVVRLSGQPPGVIREVLGRLRIKELIVPHEPSSFSEEPEFSFRHLLIRDGAYDSLPKALRATKHTKVAEWAAERAGDRSEEIAVLIASHHREALRYLEELGDAGQARREAERAAYRWSRIAGDRATALWLQDEAVTWYGEALRLADAVEAPLQERLGTARRHTEACFASATTTENEASCRRYLALAERAGDERGAGWAQAELARIVFHEGRDDETQELSDAAIRRLEPLGDTPELAFALNVAGWYRWRRGRFEEAEPFVRRAVEIAELVGARRELAEATMDLAITLANLGQPAAAVETMERAYALAIEVGAVGGLGRVYNNFGSIVGPSDLERGAAVLREGLEASRKAGAWQYVGWITGGLGDLEFQLGHLAEAERLQREAMERAAAVGDDPLLGMRTISLGQIVATRGRLEEAEESYRASFEALPEHREPQADITRLQLAAMLARRGGDAAELEALRTWVDFVETNGVPFEAAPEMMLEMALRAVTLGDVGSAGRLADRSREAVFPSGIAAARAIQGMVARDPAERGRLLEEAVGRFEALGMILHQGLTLLAFGAAERERGADPRAALERARDLLAASDAQLHLADADAALAALDDATA
jgi:class 3 adenylate cyclase/tetratricopeptide (TPR) repeat protein